MLEKLCPRLVVEKVEDIDIDALWAQGYRGMIFDLDNTLVSWRRTSLAPPVTAWLERARALGFRLCILSNCLFRRRVARLSRQAGIPAIPKAKKPQRRWFQQALDLLETQVEDTVVVGDQVFTDVLGGNRMGLYTILVLPVDRREFYVTIVQRTAEKIVLFRLRRKGLLRAAQTTQPGVLYHGV
ncbi:MAG: YqeG family HAD IIIA-type phosphatase [Proteobacteria bacterium]|nr:YqeG family HAD IIIA-type phosphatase [Pseudomonadota bacterium]